jgi:hypothetical protein
MLARVCTTSSAVRERERESEKERKRKRERERERERERCRMFPESLFSFLKGMTGDLAPFSYLVLNKRAKPRPSLKPKSVPC